MQGAVAAQPNGHDGDSERGGARGGARVDAATLQRIDALIEAFVSTSKALVDEARAAGFPEFADQVDDLRKQIQSARRRLERAADA